MIINDIELKQIDLDRDLLLIENCKKLVVNKEQEDFVDNPIVSLEEAKKFTNAFPMAVLLSNSKIKDKKEIIGLLFYEFISKDKTEFLIWDFMIDKKYQNRGYGKKVMNILMDFLKTNFNCRRVEIAYVKENNIVKKLYQSLGFVETGVENKDNEIVMEYYSIN